MLKLIKRYFETLYQIIMSLNLAKIMLKRAFYTKISIPISIPKLKMNSEINTDSDIEN